MKPIAIPKALRVVRPSPLSGGTWHLRDDFTTRTLAAGSPWTKIRTCSHVGQLQVTVGGSGAFYLNAGGYLGEMAYLASAGGYSIYSWKDATGASDPLTGGSKLSVPFAAGLWIQARLLFGADDPWFHFGLKASGDDAWVMQFDYRGIKAGSVHNMHFTPLGGSLYSLHLDAGYAQPSSVSGVTDLVPFDVGMYVRRLIDATHAECEVWIRAGWLHGCHPDSEQWLCVWKGIIDPTAINGGEVALNLNFLAAGVNTSLRVTTLEMGTCVYDPAQCSKHRYLAHSAGVGMATAACVWVPDPSLPAGGRMGAAVYDALTVWGVTGHIDFYTASDAKLANWTSAPLFAVGGGTYYRDVQAGSSGQTVLVVASKAGGAHVNLVGKVSENGGLTFGDPFDIDTGAYDCVACGCMIIRLKSGRWVLAYHKSTSVILVAYTDAVVPNTGWHVVSLANATPANEPSVAECSDGSLLLIARDPSDAGLEAVTSVWYSRCASPAGADIATWTTPARYDGKEGRDYIPNSGDPVCILRGQFGRLHMFGSGRGVLDAGAGHVGRKSLLHWISEDAGVTWKLAADSPLLWGREIPIQYFRAATDGRRLLVGTWATERICGAMVDIKGGLAEDGP